MLEKIILVMWDIAERTEEIEASCYFRKSYI